MSQPNTNAIDVTKLSTEQLAQIYKQISVEMNALQQTMPIINQSINACCDCIEAAKTLKT